MWKPLSAISSVLLLGSAFVTHNFNTELTQEKKLLREAEANLASIKAHKAKAEADHEDYKKQAATAKSEEDAMKAELTESQSKQKEATTTLETSKSKLADVHTQKADWVRKIDDLGGLEVIKQELTTLAANKVENEGKISQRKATYALNLQKKAEQEAGLGAMKKKSQMQAQGLLAESFKGSIAEVDSQWGFITINKGNSANVVRNAKLDVMRGAEKIASIVVRNVNPASAVCDVLAGTLMAGQQILAGDAVVVNAESSEKNLAASSTTSTTTTAAGAGAPAAAPTPAADPFASAPAAPAADPFAAAPAPAADAAPAAATPAPAPAATADPFAPAPAPAPAQP